MYIVCVTIYLGHNMCVSICILKITIVTQHNATIMHGVESDLITSDANSFAKRLANKTMYHHLCMSETIVSISVQTICKK